MAEQLILSNGIIQATFSTKGAELLSVIKDGQEKIWIGDPDVWQLMGGISAPLLLFKIIMERLKMIEKLRKLNHELELYSIRDEQFKKYGNVLNIKTQEIVDACHKLPFPKTGSEYIPSVDSLENLEMSENLRQIMFGGCPAQIGITHGHNSFMNGLEYHRCSEVNIAATPLVLILGLQYEMEGIEYDSSKVKAFYLEKGDAIEVYATSLHFCPCQVSDDGFSCVTVLPKDTNTLLDKPSDDKLLLKKNKWIICHDKNQELIDRGVYPGIHGVNYEVKY